MGNTAGREKGIQMSGEDSGPTMLSPGSYPSRSASDDGDSSFAIRYSTPDCEDQEYEDTVSLEDTEPHLLPSVVKWEGGGNTVMVSFDDGKTKIPMVKSQSNFYTIVDLPEGMHKYKFFVDGQWKCDQNEPTVTGDSGSVYNTVTVKASDFEVFEALAQDSLGSDAGKTVLSGSPPGDYSQHVPPKFNLPSTSAPPVLPPQLLQVILNSEAPLQCEPTVLPEPNHVMLNHLYALSIKDGVMVMSGTHRYRKKYVTTVLYKPT